MSLDYDEPEREEEEKPRDAKIDAAKVAILRDVFEPAPDAVFYQRQIEVMLERKFFHWVTAKALNELALQGIIAAETRPHPQFSMRLYWSPANRYWKRRASVIEKLVLRFSDSGFTRGVGHHGEAMFDAALPRHGFMPVGYNTRSYDGRTWPHSEHDLDRIFVKDGFPYGVEIKNTLPYIPRDEMRLKVQMCRYLGLTPLFIVRAAPASYIEEVRQAGGFTLVFEWQFYPFGQEAFAREVHAVLGLKVSCPRGVEDGTIQRLAAWHERRLNALGKPG